MADENINNIEIEENVVVNPQEFVLIVLQQWNLNEASISLFQRK